MLDVKDVEKIEGRKVREITKKEDAENVYIVVFEDNLEEDWKYENGKWTIIA